MALLVGTEAVPVPVPVVSVALQAALEEELAALVDTVDNKVLEDTQEEQEDSVVLEVLAVLVVLEVVATETRKEQNTEKMPGTVIIYKKKVFSFNDSLPGQCVSPVW